jgi:hypothetical protein
VADRPHRIARTSGAISATAAMRGAPRLLVARRPVPHTLAAMPAAGAFAPLRHPAFRMLWTASLAPNVGLWVQNTGAGWLMTSLAPSPLMVSLVQGRPCCRCSFSPSRPGRWPPFSTAGST